jgi:hypothetical protein
MGEKSLCFIADELGAMWCVAEASFSVAWRF